MFDLFSEKMDTEMIKELGEFKVDLDGRFSSVRTRETNLGMLYSVFGSFEDKAAREKQPALACQMAQSRNLVLISLEIPVVFEESHHNNNNITIHRPDGSAAGNNDVVVIFYSGS